MAVEYRENDGAVFRTTDGTVFTLEIYKGKGKWESWGDTADWLYGTSLDGAAAKRAISDFDK